MLTHLYISNIVLIEKLNLEFGPGLNILTGETGAGKSILLDALALALGARSDAGLVRSGCDTASVIAEFDDVPDTVRAVMNENGIECDDTVILRRTLGADGKSRAWINDMPASVRVLKQIGDALVEIHGQFANHTLLNPATHMAALDAVAARNIDGFGDLRKSVTDAYTQYHSATVELRELSDIVAHSAMERDFLAHNVAELRALNPQPGEEEDLATRRADMMNAEKNAAILADAAGAIAAHGNSLDAQIFDVAHILQRIKTEPNPYQDQIDSLYNAADIIAAVAQKLEPEIMDTAGLDAVEERLFAIRAAVRKYRTPSDELPAVLERMAAQLDTIDNSDAKMQKLKSRVAAARARFDELADKLTNARRDAAEILRRSILRELPDLKLAQADFAVEITPADASSTGRDGVMFMIKTNPGSPFAPLHKSASGGELARLMLALRVVLAADESGHVFVFDEVDTGISGATASAVGARLAILAAASQALVITHSAQVAGYADRHYKIEKHVADAHTTTCVSEITGDARINEIARIISGAEITPESVATARTLIKSE